MERQLQLWTTPHGVIWAAMASNATVQGRTIAFAVPGRYTVKATLDGAGLVEKVEAVLSSPVVGDMPVEIRYSDYREFGDVKFPTRIRQSAGGFPAVDFTVTDVRPNAPVDIQVPDAIRQATKPYARVSSEAAADGVWYVTGGSHHSVVIEMKDHVIVVEAPLNDERATAVIAEARRLVPGKPIRAVINSHHHFDHAGGLRAFAAEGIGVITHETNRAFFETALVAPATMTPDRQQAARRKVAVEGVRDKRRAHRRHARRRDPSHGRQHPRRRHAAGPESWPRAPSGPSRRRPGSSHGVITPIPSAANARSPPAWSKWWWLLITAADRLARHQAPRFPDHRGRPLVVERGLHHDDVVLISITTLWVAAPRDVPHPVRRGLAAHARVGLGRLPDGVRHLDVPTGAFGRTSVTVKSISGNPPPRD